MDKPWLKFYEQGVRPHLSYPDTPLDTILSEAARTHPEHSASNFVLQYILGGRIAIAGKHSYRHLDHLVNQFAAVLAQLGVHKGDRVALMLPNSPQFVITFFATLRLGAILVTINPTYTSRELHHQLIDSGAETLILLDRFWHTLHAIRASTPLQRVIVTSIADMLGLPARLLVHISQRRSKDYRPPAAAPGVFFFFRLLKQQGLPRPSSSITPDDVALLQYTGGTTATPRAAMLTHRNLMANLTQTIAWTTDVRQGQEKVMGALPFFHAYGMMVGMLYALRMQCELVMIPNPRQIEHIMQVIQKERCALLPGVPALYLGIINHPRVGNYDLRSIRVCISGAAPLPAAVQQRFEALTGGRLVEGYGLSEASPVTHCNPIYGLRKPGIGVPFPDVEARLVDLETGTHELQASGQPGELCVRGPQVMQGYWKGDSAGSPIDQEGWLHTGDVCLVDEDGFFSLLDRKKDIIIVGGFKVLPHDVEEVLLLHPDVQEAAVVGIPHPERGDETVKAYIVARSGSQPTAEELRSFCKQYLAPYKRPRQIEFRAELPKTVVGKVLRRVLVTEEQALLP